MRFGFIGAGKVGFSLAKYLAVNGIKVSGFYSEFIEDAKEAAAFTGSGYFDNLESLANGSDVIFITVPDGAIAGVWKQLKSINISDKILCHTSGALSSDIFSDIAEHNCFGYSVHPLFAVSDRYKSYKELPNTLFTIEGSSEKLEEVKGFFVALGNKVVTIDAQNKVMYHAAAAIASNLVVGLLGMSYEMLMRCGFDDDLAREALSPIVKNNIDHVFDDGVVAALTGPIERGDADTVLKHIKAMDGSEREAYIAVSKQVLKIAKAKNPERNFARVEEVLEMTHI